VDLKSFLSTVNKYSLVGLSVPLPVPEEDSAIIGYYSLETDAGHISLPQSELKAAAGFLYTAGTLFPQETPSFAWSTTFPSLI
jgi:hypothetical protein